LNLTVEQTHPKYLLSNSTSHKWAFGAIAELVDNALDARAKTFTIEVGEEKVGNKAVKFIALQDDGCGMTPSEVHAMMSFGITGDKVGILFFILSEARIVLAGREVVFDFLVLW
jgi:sensor histidine kinase regulating citrate/malate metabolism